MAKIRAGHVEEKKKISIFDAKDTIIDKLRKVGELGVSSEDNKKSLHQRAKDRKAAIKELSENVTEELYERLTSSPEDLPSHFRSIGRLLGKYNKTNQLLIQAQRPETLGVASKSTWEDLGYTVPDDADPIQIEARYTYLKKGDPGVEKWINENPLKEIAEWYENTNLAKQGIPFAEYILERLKTADKKAYGRLGESIEKHVAKFSHTETPSPELRRKALDVYMKNRLGLVVRGSSQMESPEEILLKQKEGEERKWFMLPPFLAAQSLLKFCAVIYSKRLGPDAMKRTPYEEEKARREFISRYTQWRNDRNMKTAIIEHYKELQAKETKDRQNGIKTPDSQKTGMWPVVVFPTLQAAYAYEDVTPGKKARALAYSGKVECDEELYNAVRDVFRVEFPVEEVPGVLPSSIKATRNEGVFHVSMSEKPDARVIEIAREWARRECASLGANGPVFKELFALSVLTSIGMDNPHVDILAMKGLPKEEIKAGVEQSYRETTRLLKRLQKKVGKIAETKVQSMQEEIESSRAAQEIEWAEKIERGEGAENEGGALPEFGMDWN